MKPGPILLLCLTLQVGLAALAAAQTPSMSFPLTPAGGYGERGIALAPDAVRIEALAGLERVRLRNVPVPTPTGIEFVDAALTRYDPVAAGALLLVDGREAGEADALGAGVSTWSGHVVGEPGSSVYLAFGRTGSRGWIAREGHGTVHLLAIPGAGGDWRRPSGALVHESDAFLAGVRPGRPCGVRPAPGERPMAPSADRSGAALALATVLECKVSVETDYQYFELFGDLQAAQDYAVQLFGAVGSRYFQQSQVVLTLPYLGLYTSPADPWSTPDGAGGAGDLLDEFRSAWAGAIPGGGKIAHFLSGAIWGGGVAYVDVLCSPWWGFGVSTGIGGSTPFPVAQGPLNWDFDVMAHEIGHNFGSWHTHDYCPPLDQCSPWFGACQTEQVCISDGTIMSYCHVCPGGEANKTTYFHTQIATIIRQEAEASCLPPLACSGCSCPWPTIQSVSPLQVEAFVPGGQTITLAGCRFLEAVAVTAGGVPAGFTALDDGTLTFEMPLVPELGLVDVVVASDFGPSPPIYLLVLPTSSPGLDLEYAVPGTDFLLRAFGAPLRMGSPPQDTFFLTVSPDLVPSVLPGVLSLDIGQGFTSLYLIHTAVIPDKSWDEYTFDISGLPLGLKLHFQGVVLSATSPGFPLVASNFVSATVFL